MTRPDIEDRARLSRHLDRLLRELQTRRTLTNHQIRAIAGSRGMGRVNDLIRQHGYDLAVRKADGSTWIVEYRGRRAAPAMQPDLF